MVDSKLDDGRIEFGAREDVEQKKAPKPKEGANERTEARERFAEEHPAGYMAARLSEPASRDAGRSADGGFARGPAYREGGFDHGRGVWGAAGEEQASAEVHARPMEPLTREPAQTEHTGHPDTRDEAGYGAHGSERLSDDPRAFDLRGGPPSGSVDARLRGEIEEALRRAPGLDARGMEVSVHHGEAFLTGTVPERHMDEIAEQISLRVKGVRRVHNGLRLMRTAQARAPM